MFGMHFSQSKNACLLNFYTSNLVSSKLSLNLLCYTAVPVFFQKWRKPAQLNILSIGVTAISMFLLYRPLSLSLLPLSPYSYVNL